MMIKGLNKLLKDVTQPGMQIICSKEQGSQLIEAGLAEKATKTVSATNKSGGFSIPVQIFVATVEGSQLADKLREGSYAEGDFVPNEAAADSGMDNG